MTFYKLPTSALYYHRKVPAEFMISLTLLHLFLKLILFYISHQWGPAFFLSLPYRQPSSSSSVNSLAPQYAPGPCKQSACGNSGKSHLDWVTMTCAVSEGITTFTQAYVSADVNADMGGWVFASLSEGWMKGEILSRLTPVCVCVRVLTWADSWNVANPS